MWPKRKYNKYIKQNSGIIVSILAKKRDIKCLNSFIGYNRLDPFLEFEVKEPDENTSFTEPISYRICHFYIKIS